MVLVKSSPHEWMVGVISATSRHDHQPAVLSVTDDMTARKFN